MTILTTAAVMTVLLFGEAPESKVFELVPAHGQVRDSVIDLPRAALYLAVYDHNEVWQIDLATREIRTKTPVGKGPAGLALSHDGAVLACINRLSKTLSLIRTADMEVIASPPCGDGPQGIAALPGGGFAVAVSFSDRIILIDPGRPEQATVVEHVSGVPNAVAASESFLAVTTRVPPALLIFPGGVASPSASIPLPDVPHAVAVLKEDRFAVATRSGLVLVNARESHVEARREMAVVDVAVDGDRIYALAENRVEVLDISLRLRESLALVTPGRSLSVFGGLAVVLSPTRKAWQIFGTTPWHAGEPAPKIDRGPGAAVPQWQPTQPELEVAELPREPAQEDRPLPTEEERIAAAKQPPAAEAGAKAPEEATGTRAPYRRLPRRGARGSAETYAPRPGLRPSLLPLERSSRRTVFETLLEGPGFGAEAGGFEPIDWSKPLENLQADVIQIPPGETDIIQALGNVRLTLGNTSFSADELYINQGDREIQALGEVELKQPTATLQADEAWYRFAQEPEQAPPRALIDVTDEEQRHLSLGSFEAEKAYLVEPGRELTADHITYDPATRTGEAENAHGRVGVFYFGASRLRILGPASVEGEQVWLTTCDHDPPHYRIRLRKGALREGNVVVGVGARLKLFEFSTPFYWPRWRHARELDLRLSVDFDAGHRAQTGYYVNVVQRYAVTPNVDLGVRVYPTQKQGIGLGFEGNYDFMDRPASTLFRSAGEFRVLGTTKERGLAELYHRHEVTENTVALLQVEQWFDGESLKDLYYEEFRDRTGPRTFANLTYTQPDYIATATLRKRTNGFGRETERAPEVSFHLLERKLAGGLYLTFDAVGGYNEREPLDVHATRLVHVGRLTYDWNLSSAFNIAPFLELEGSWYSDELRGDESSFRFSTTVGTTVQTRLHKTYPGRFGFEAFKHLVVPSITYSYRPNPTTGVGETPRFDALDNVFGRSRLESKLDNVVLGRDAETGEVWQVARLTLYQGTDFSNEISKAQDYEIELDLRPRPWWGLQMVAERHNADGDLSLDSPFAVERYLLDLYENVVGEPYDPELAYQFDARDGDFSRVLAYCYYDDEVRDGRLNGRIGFAYTETEDRVFNREILYGVGYQVSDKWSLAFEHRYDFEQGELSRQRYEIRRNLHCWEAGLQFNDRQDGFDINLAVSLAAFPRGRSAG